MLISKANKILAKCEADLRVLVASAVDAGDYDSVLRITGWAKQIGAMSSGAASSSEASQSVAITKKPPLARPAYPRFIKRGDQLVKIGWSKKEKSEYEHKAPKGAALALGSAIVSAGKDGRIFQIESLLPLHDPKGENDIPDYQVYLVIAWWRSAGLLDQHGRQGYSVPNPKQFAQVLDSAWTQLSEE